MDNQNTTYAPKKWFQSWRIIYPILGLVLVVEIILGLKTLFTPLPKSEVASLQPISGAKLMLLAPKNSYKIGENIPITVKVSTSGHNTTGTDLVLKFDPRVLDASPSAIKRGKIYDDYPLIDIDGKNGVIRISAVATISAKNVGFNGIGELVSVNFTAKSKGTANLIIDFSPNQTTESNVFDTETSQDVLEKVYNFKVTIQ